ncbi:unnamed protein product [Brassicogethes aeneus]|uniref:Uncharacterized protein n=1 Tax=Brassicogethes aeneus TaxID=1431903 RepID=A0A9P0BE19_BRAAE|nr:unnamed protein product [Brassicogethes aeneus]
MSAIKKPAEYKEYVNFLQNYNKSSHNKKDDASSDSGLNSPFTGSSASLNSDSTEVSEVDTSPKVKTEICIEIKPHNPIEKTVHIKKADKDCIIKTTHVQRRGSVKNMSRMFEVETRKKNTVKPPLPLGKTSLEKLLEKDSKKLAQDAVKTNNNMNSIKRDLLGKPSLEKLLKEDEQNSQQDILKSPEIVKPISNEDIVKPLTNLEELIKENTTIKIETLKKPEDVQQTLEKLLFNDQNDQITLNTENIFTTIRPKEEESTFQETTSIQIKKTLEKLLSNEPTPPKEEDLPPPPPPQAEKTPKPAIPEKPVLPTSPKPTNVEFVCPPPPSFAQNAPPPPPPMPAVLPKFKTPVAQTVRVETLQKPPPALAKDLDEEKLRKKLAYGQMMNICNSYNDKANDYVATLPKAMVHQNKNIQNIIQSIALNGGLDKLCGRTNPKVE